MRFLFNLVFLLCVLILISACSTVINTTSQEVELKSNPPNAKITINGKKFGTTPQIVNIDRGSDHSVKLELEGHDSYEIQITRKLSAWFWLNALNGFIPGMLTDMITGSMYSLLPEVVEVDLQPAKVIDSEKKVRK